MTSEQQLVARIRRGSKYWGQTPPNQWFDVERMVVSDYYHVRGNNNNYRVRDLFFGVRTADGFIVDLGNGKVAKPLCREAYREYGRLREAVTARDHQSDGSPAEEAVVQS